MCSASSLKACYFEKTWSLRCSAGSSHRRPTPLRLLPLESWRDHAAGQHCCRTILVSRLFDGVAGWPYQPFQGPACPTIHLARRVRCLPPRLPSQSPPRALLEGIDGWAGIPFRRRTCSSDRVRSRRSGAFLLKNAAEQVLTEAAWKIDRSIPAAETPLRITETAYWINKHRRSPTTYGST